MRAALAAFFVAAGALHFLDPSFYLKIVPPWVPAPRAAVFVSGFFEILFGALLFYPPARRLAAIGLILLLVAVFPANVHMALHAADFPKLPEWVYWARLPLQGVLIALVWKAGRAL